jgi:hypothetical protein
MLTGPLIFMVVSLILIISAVGLSSVKTKKKDDSLGIIIALITQVEALNRVIIVILLWTSQHLFIFCIIGMNLMSNVTLGIYFTSVVTDAICKQIKSIPKDSKLFRATVIMSQITGTNTMRLIYSNFLGLKAFSSIGLKTLPYFFKPLEVISLISLAFCCV